MTEREIRRRLPHASAEFIRLNANAAEVLTEPEPDATMRTGATIPGATCPNLASEPEKRGRTAETPFRLLVTLLIPPKELGLNSRCHWAAKAKAVKAYRHTAMLAALKTLPTSVQPMLKTATVQVTWWHRTAHRFDGAENLHGHLKAAFDGLQDAGIYVNDSGLTALPPIQGTDKNNPRVELLITDGDQPLRRATFGDLGLIPHG